MDRRFIAETIGSEEVFKEQWLLNIPLNVLTGSHRQNAKKISNQEEEYTL